MIEELIALTKEMRQANARREALGLSEEELAFYDTLETNDSAGQVLGDETLRTIARELVKRILHIRQFPASAQAGRSSARSFFSSRGFLGSRRWSVVRLAIARTLAGYCRGRQRWWDLGVRAKPKIAVNYLVDEIMRFFCLSNGVFVSDNFQEIRCADNLIWQFGVAANNTAFQLFANIAG